MRLARGDWSLELAPAVGGAIAALVWRGQDLLRPAPPGATDPLAMSSFPLVPYANRIGHGRFVFDGQEHHLPINYAGQAHPLHGVGWLRSWKVVGGDEAVVTLAHRHDGDGDWPWRYAAEQRFALDDDGLTVTLSITSEDDRAMPVSLGFHPYFAVSGVSSLRFEAAGVWLTDAQLLPTECVAADRLADFAAGAPVLRKTLVDHCYAGWSGSAVIARIDGDVRLSATDTPLLHVYMPPGEDFFCAEPVTAMPDAFNRDAGDVLAPGQTRTVTMRIGVG
jgi:aldose 1-epimerase